ncbi:MATE family efflux transporter [Clostridium sporogenes]|uniref:MATE family efflux transporter n=1 Tax=Clostridium sporogenes TaxID=1509 RepID=UPI0013D89F3E|nr:MATE family efflux transporter [Clostridium sporogenes]NFF67119.1 MATE family efflux transporter [Clostridium sporogenes]NFF97333.1 MATE family efflux transporter [Clostridium sporogenes]NFG04869.1 MATE family efflux transporter [Clostridium sporogenes]NFG51906.1 MATE family efflux transporter [Clostridium sporogenes]NFP83532.1 MATE family efflux transporter [Clostridium sporogenes]
MNKKENKIKMMSEGNITKVLFQLGIPVIIGMLVTSLYNVVDAMFVGRLGTSQMGAVSIAYPIGQLIIGLGLTFGSGSASYISRLLGEKNNKQADCTASTALFTSIIVGLITIVVTMCFLDKVLTFLGATQTILPYAREFAIIYIPGSILNVINVTMNNISASEGATKISMTSMLIGAGVNVVLDPIYIYMFQCGIKGSAIATVISQGVTTLLYVWYISSGKSNLHISIKHFSMDKTIYVQILKIGIPTLLFQLLSSTSMGLTNTASSHYGDSAVAAMGVVTRVLALGSYVIFGYAKGFQTVSGFNFGAKNYKRLREAISVSLKWSSIFCAVIEIILLIFSRQIIGFFSKDASVIAIGSDALRANSITFILFGFQYIYTTLFLALGKAFKGTILSIARQGIFFIPVILILPRILGLNGIIFTQPIVDVMTTILTVIFAAKLQRKINYASQELNQKTIRA